MSIKSTLERDRATAVPFGSTTDIPQTDVERAIKQVQTNLAAHIADPSGGGRAWTLIEARTVDGDETFTGLGGYSELSIMLYGVALTTTDSVELQVSENGGSTWLETDEYVFLGNGSAADPTGVGSIGMAGGQTSFIYGFDVCVIQHVNLSSPKHAAARAFLSDFIIKSAAPIDAVRVVGPSGNPLVSGTIYLYGR